MLLQADSDPQLRPQRRSTGACATSTAARRSPRLDEPVGAVPRHARPADHPALAGRTLAPLAPQPAGFDWKPKAP